jgi:hypothetical protein
MRQLHPFARRPQHVIVSHGRGARRGLEGAEAATGAANLLAWRGHSNCQPPRGGLIAGPVRPAVFLRSESPINLALDCRDSGLSARGCGPSNSIDHFQLPSRPWTTLYCLPSAICVL